MKSLAVRLSLCLSALVLLASAAGAQPISYVLVPTISPGVTQIKVEMGRNNISLSDVHATYVAEGTSGLTASPSNLKVYVGPSTSKQNPLLSLTEITPSGGMVVLQPVAGLDAVEVAMEVEQGPVRTAWKLPLLTPDQFFGGGSTAYVLNLSKTPDGSSGLQIFNIANKAANCSVQVLRPKGSVLEERDGLTVPAVGVIRIPDILTAVPRASASGLNAAVTCDRAFYAMGALFTADRWNTRVQYPVAQFPARPVAVVLDSRPGEFFRASFNNPEIQTGLALDPNTNYHTLSIDFDVSVADPPNENTIFRNVIGMFRKGGRRFGKTLFFGSFENFRNQKYVIDLGTPFIETTLKRNFDLIGGHGYHVSITLDNDQQSLHYVITNRGGGLVADIIGALFNNFNVVDGEAPQIEFGLPGVADNAYFPPYGWHFSNLQIVATK